MRFPTTPTKKLLLLTAILMIGHLAQAQDFYWVGGSGTWDNLSHWSKISGDPNAPTGVLPGAGSTVIIDDLSGPASGFTLTIRPGEYEVKNLFVTSRDPVTILFNGTSNNSVSFSIYGDITLSSAAELSYASTSLSHNVWKFEGANFHNVTTGNKDLFNVELLNTGGTFHQRSEIVASAQIRMYAGTWTSNGHDISSGKLFFQDREPSNAPLTKIFNTGGSDIYADEWESGFTYGSLTVNGNHRIFTSRFRGSPKQQNGPAFLFDEVHLLEYSDAPIGGVIIEHNNFECRSCEFENIIIEDTGDTKFADQFTVNQAFTVRNPGSRILFNGGNNRTSKATFNGTVNTPPTGDCGEKTLFSSVHTDFTVFSRNAGTLDIKDATLNNIGTEGNATFNLSNGLLEGASTGWSIINPPTAQEYVWIGPADGSFGDWDDPANWALDNGNSNGCIPSASDNVYITDRAKGKIRIPSPYLARCNNFIWTNKDGLELKLDGTNTLESALELHGSFDLNSSAILTPVLRHEIYFSSASANEIITRNVQLPEIWFLGDLANWFLGDDLNCDRLTFEGGTLNTQSQDITTAYWNTLGDNPKQFNLGSSHITVAGECALSRTANANVTINPGTSLVECDQLTSNVEELYDVKLTNTSNRLLNNFSYRFNKLILGGTGDVTVQNDLTLNELVFAVDGSTLVLNINGSEEFSINGGIESMASVGNPGNLKAVSAGSRMEISREIPGNICVTGPVAFQDIAVAIPGVFNAPEGIDNGNNDGINFNDGGTSADLYWIGGSGEWSDTNNWSKVSGGCPDNKNPNDATRLFFNNFGFFNDDETVSIPSLNNCGELYFTNSARSVTLDIALGLTADLLDITNGDVSLTGSNLFTTETKVQSGSVLSTDMLNFTTDKLETNSSLIIIRNGSNVTVNN